MNGPTWPEIEEQLRSIFARRYFANNGPLVRELDHRIAEYLDVPYAVCVANEMFGMQILGKALGVRGDVLVPAFASKLLLNALESAGLTPVLCDIDARTWTPASADVEGLLSDRVVGIVGIRLFGVPLDADGLERLAREHDLKVIFDASDAFGRLPQGKTAGACGDGEVFSFRHGTVMNAAEGACITTADEEMAKRFRTIRNFHAQETFASVTLRTNGKMSEAQAALALLRLSEMPSRIHANRERYKAYARAFQDAPTVRVFPFTSKEDCNYQRLMLYVDLPDDKEAGGTVCNALHSLPLRRPLAHCDFPTEAFPVCARLRANLFELPNDDQLTVARISDLSQQILQAIGAV